MLSIKLLNNFLTLISLTFIVTIGNAYFTHVAQAGETKIEEATREGLPNRRVAGGSRGDSCTFTENTLTALIPNNAVTLTASASPNWFFYVPATNQAKVLEFVIRDANDNLVHEQTFTIKGDSGIINVNLPNDKQLKSNQEYQWYFSLICNPENRSRDLVVEGFTKRVDLDSDLKAQLQNSQPIQQAELYLKANLWHETLTTLAKLHDSPIYADAACKKWQEVLGSIELGGIAQQPLIDNYANNRLLAEVRQ